ncbi:MAG TPA: immunoglobulin-like domain-containing protein, partial [Nitrosopumilaceae archaeon]|nr:immunoglobulin-like domain-containing protein [Nitrosopumilaceae archaeon]
MNNLIKTTPIIFGILMLTSLSGFQLAEATINSDTISGWRNSQYGTSNQNDHNYWISVSQQMVNKFPGSSPGGVLVVGELDGQPGTTEDTLLQFPNPGGSYPHVNFISTDQIEPMLDAYDQYGLKVYLQPESAHAEIPMLMDLIMDRYKHHPSVIGFGVDAEWYFEADYPGYGKALSTAEVNAWATQVKTYNPNYKLMVKHWDYDQLSNARPSNVLFLTDTERLGSQNNAVNEYIDWIDHFNGAEVGFQYAYPSDQSWWGNFNDPAAQIIQPVLDARPNANIGALFLVDFSVENILSEQNIGSPCAPNCDYDNPPPPPTSDTQKPVITPLGASKSIPFGSVYTELGATVTDNDPAYSGSVTIGGSVNTSVPGQYVITYTAPSDAAGNIPNEKSITITVQENTPPSTGPVLFSDDFESGFSKWTESGEGDWKLESPTEVQVPGHSSNLVAHSDNCDSTCTITMKSSIDLSSSSSATLSFWRFVDNSLDNGEYLKVELYDGTKWNTVSNWTHSSGDDNVWHQETVNLDSYLGESDFNVRFVTHESSSREEVEIDDVVIDTTGSPTPSDTIHPTITPMGTSKLIPLGSTYTELGAIVTDNDPAYSGSVTIGGSVNTSVPGTYVITYTAPADAAGNIPNEKSITISVESSTGTINQIAGWRSSQYGDYLSSGHDQSDPAYWISVAQQMTAKFPGFTPGGVLVIGEIDGAPGSATSTSLPFPKPAGSYPNVNFGTVDKIEPLLDAYDSAGLKVYLQVESADADIPMLMNLIMNKYKHHPSVVGFGVDAEWYHEAQFPGWGRPLTSSEVNAWATQVKTFDPDYDLLVKHWDTSYLSNARPNNVLFLTDSENIGSLSSTINEYVAWIDHFGTSEVGFQIGYPSDQSWWSNLNDPAAEIMNPVLVARPNANIGAIFWVDFSALTVFPDTVVPTPTVTINDVTKAEGNSGTSNFVFAVTRNVNTPTISVQYQTADDTASASADYGSLSSTLNFASGSPLTQTITVPVKGDTTVEQNEKFNVNLSNCSGCIITDNQGVGTITNDDSPPSDTEPPTITPMGTSKSISLGSTYTEMGATVTDNDPAYSGSVTIGGSVNTSVPGTYVITYTAPSDAAGNIPNEKSITITVQENTPPSTGPVLFSDDFESGFAKWTESGEGDWKLESPAELQVPGHSSNLVAHSDNCDSTCTITMKSSIDLSSSSSATLSFWRFVDGDLDAGEYLKVQLYDGNQWNTVFNWTHQSGDDNKWHQESVDLNDYLGGEFNLRFVTHQSFWLEEAEIDDVLIDTTGSPTPPSDTIKPTIIPMGTSKSIPFGSTYTELGATVTDNDPAYSGSVTIGGSVNTSVPGQYVITYTAPSDAAGNTPDMKSITITVQEEIVLDTEKPVITPLGSSKSISLGSTYNELGAIVTDNDPAYSGSVTIGGSVNTSVLGQYVITYTAPSDAAGNTPDMKSITIIIETSTIELHQIAGWRSSQYGDYLSSGHDQSDPTYWISVAQQMTAKFPGFTPGGILVVGEIDGPSGSATSTF